MNFSTIIETSSQTPQNIAAPESWLGHIPFAMWLIRKLRPSIFVELGTHTGNSYFSFCQSVAASGQATRCYAVDTWQGDKQAGFYDDTVFHSVQKINKEKYQGFSTLLRKSFDEALSDFADQSIGLLHIDGLHTYEAVKHDFETWRPKLQPGAIVLFHDTEARHDDFGVYIFWEELRRKYPLSFAFLHSWGLGVLQIPADDQPPLEIFTDVELHKKLYDFFTTQGHHIEGIYKQQQQARHIGELEEAIARIRKEAEQAINELHTEINRQREVLAQLSAQRDDLDREKNTLLQNNEKLCQQSAKLWHKKEELLHKNETQQQSIAKLNNEKNQLSTQKEILAAEKQLLQQRITELTRLIASKKQRGRISSALFSCGSALRSLLQMRSIKQIARYCQYRRLINNREVFFSREFYHNRYPDIYFSPLGAEDHYFLTGWREGRDPSPYFHTGWYLQHAPDVEKMEINPLLHYITKGWIEGRDPSPSFNTAKYFSHHPEIFATKAHPLHHYYIHSRQKKTKEEITFLPATDTTFALHKAVDIIIPLYLPSAQTAQIFTRLVRSLRKSYPDESPLLRFIIIDDASPEATGQQIVAKEFGEQREDTLFLHNSKNLGFVGTVERGIKKARKNADIVLLNCDTEIHGDVFERLQTLCHRQENIASVTPLSNRATIACLQNWPHGVDAVQQLSPEECAELVHGAGLQSPIIPAPTAHGFCMYINRTALNAIGGFDTRCFGKGYGEENDWSMRAIYNGFIHLISVETYVHHHETQSFTSEQKKQFVETNYQLLIEKHPCYHQLVQQYLQADPLHNYRQILNCLISLATRKSKTICFLLHDSFHRYFGGVQCHIRDLGNAIMEQDNINLLIVSPMTLHGQRFECTLINREKTTYLQDLDEHAIAALLHSVDKYIDALHVHHLMGINTHIKHWLENSRVPRKIFTFHDFAIFGKNPYLLKETREFGPAEKREGQTNWQRNSEKISADLSILREFSDLLVPSENTKKQIESLLPKGDSLPQLQVVPHLLPFIDKLPPDTTGCTANSESKNIVFLGAMSVHKGGDIFLGALQLLRQEQYTPWLFGVLDPQLMANFPDAWLPIVPYKNWLDLFTIGHRFGVHIVVIPSVCAETFTYTLYEALFLLKVPVIVGSYGNPADQVKKWGVGLVLDEMSPVAIRDAAKKITTDYDTYIQRVEKFTAANRQLFSAASYAEQYLQRYLENKTTAAETIQSTPVKLPALNLPDTRRIENNQAICADIPGYRLLFIHNRELPLHQQIQCENIALALRRENCTVVEVTPENLFTGVSSFDIIYIYKDVAGERVRALTSLAQQLNIPVVSEIDATTNAKRHTDYLLASRCQQLPKQKQPVLYRQNYWSENRRMQYERHYNLRCGYLPENLGLYLSPVAPLPQEGTEAIHQIMARFSAATLTLFSSADWHQEQQIWLQRYPGRIHLANDLKDEEYLHALTSCKALILPALTESPDFWNHLLLEASMVGTPVITPHCTDISSMLEYNFTGWPIEHNSQWRLALSQALTNNHAHQVGKWAHLYIREYFQLDSREICKIFAGIKKEFYNKTNER